MAPSPKEQPAAGAEFFIAGRLRGIPLVSQKNGTKPVPGKMLKDSNKNVTATTIASSATSMVKPETGDARQRSGKPIQVGKRDAFQRPFVETRGARIQSQTDVLFKQTGITSSIANIVKSTTRRPQQQRTSTTAKPVPNRQRAQQTRQPTTRRPQPTTTTKRTRPQATRGPTLARAIETASGDGLPMAKMLEPISSHKMSTLEAATHSLGSSLFATGSTLPFLVADSRTATTTTTTTMQPLPEVVDQQHHRTTLTRSMQTLTTQPVNQRRNQQNVVQSRGGSNRVLADARNGYAGENWYLFNRPDGRFSAFEILVLVSNVLIVLTIILVILFNWIEMFKKRRRSSAAAAAASGSTQPKQPEQPSLGLNLNEAPRNNHANNNHKLDTTSDRASKLSLVSSGTSQVTSMTTSALDALTTTTASISAAADKAQQQLVTAGQQQQHRLDEVKRMATESTSKAVELVGQPLVGNAKKIMDEFNQSSANLANKAMAIVQPTENNFKPTAATTDGSLDKLNTERKRDELSAGPRAISRSVSDLSGGAAKQVPDDTTTSASATITPDRVQALEKLFRNTAKRDGQSKTNKADDERLIHSTSSLESIELPNNLVESIKRTAPGPLRKQVDESLAPSPNLLLGEVAGGGAEQALKAVDVGKSEPSKVAPESKASKSTDARLDQSNVNRPQNPMAEQMAQKNGTEQAPVLGPVTSKKQASEGAKTMPTIEETSKKAEPDKADSKKVITQKQQASEPTKTGVQKAKPATSQSSPQKQQQQQQQQQPQKQTAEVKNHQVVVNRLDKRKTNLEIVDLRDASVTGKMRSKLSDEAGDQSEAGADSSAWISMDGVAVVQPHSPGGPLANQQQLAAQAADPQQQHQQAIAASQMGAATMSPSEIIESRFHVDYKSKRRQQKVENGGQVKSSESMDSKQEEYVFNNIENELELDNKMRNRKYFVYVVHDGHFTARKECIARIELPPKRRITLAELRQLISNSQDISLSSLRRNRFKFVTETYRLLNENEDAAVLHQVYPTQGVFLKLNVAEQDNQVYPFKGGRNTRLSSGGGGTSTSFAPAGSSLSNATIASRRRANARTGGFRNTHSSQDGTTTLPAIEVNKWGGVGGQSASRTPRASSVGRGRQTVGGGGMPGGAYKRSKSSVQMGRTNRSSAGAGGMRRGASGTNLNDNNDILPSIGTLQASARKPAPSAARRRPSLAKPSQVKKQTIGEASSEMGANMISGAKKLLSSTFGF